MALADPALRKSDFIPYYGRERYRARHSVLTHRPLDTSEDVKDFIREKNIDPEKDLGAYIRTKAYDLLLLSYNCALTVGAAYGVSKGIEALVR